MADKPRSDASSARGGEEQLAHALVSRGLLTREEVQACKPAAGDDVGPEALLARLQAGGLLTAGQARRAAAELTALLNQKIPGYLLMEKVGQGATGTVYKARQLSMNRLVAVKVLHPRLAASKDYLDALTREAHLAAKLSHNNIVQAIDVGSAGSVHFFVMEFVEGKTIREELEAGKVYTEREGVEIIVQIAQALQHAGRRGLIHRDVKPANIMLTADGIAKLADLGFARERSDRVLAKRERGMTIGTPYYIAPEQIEAGEDIDARADLYSLGATLYHMVTGQPPFPAKDVDEVLRMHLEAELTPPDHLNQSLSSGLGEVVELLMAKKRQDRYRSAEDLIIDLECLLNGEAPKLARKKIEAASLRALAQGDDEDDDEREPPRPPGAPWPWVWVLGGLLGFSGLVNLILLLRR
jgi:eukaryotic-like serine/threonine-protein kinase